MKQCRDAMSHEDHGTKYAHIVFLQEHEAEEAIAILENEGEEAAAKHLSQWDYGEYHEISDRPGNGTSDHVSELFIPGCGDYRLTYNLGLPYIGLEAILCGCTNND